MTEFVTVRSSGENDPQDTYKVGAEEFAAHPESYIRVDESVPVEPPRSGKGSGIKAWVAYADAIGVEHAPDASLEDVIAAVDAAHQPVGDPNTEGAN